MTKEQLEKGNEMKLALAHVDEQILYWQKAQGISTIELEGEYDSGNRWCEGIDASILTLDYLKKGALDRLNAQKQMIETDFKNL